MALIASAETIHERVKRTKHRPLLMSGDLMADIQKLLAQRTPVYKKADLCFISDGKSATQVADEIFQALEKDKEFEFGKDWI